ncbi:MAG: carboxypeptidase-like regulatory domain-containing protein [Treponema sp.]|nr:carboxypeptidase-like regulatory domain-containing protein [Treponema sp.]
MVVFFCFGCQQPESVKVETTGSISGKVVYFGAGAEDAQIYIAGTSYSAVSDSDGKFVLSGIPAGEDYSVIVSYLDEKSKIDQVSVLVNQETELGEIVIERNNEKSFLKDIYSAEEGIFFVAGGAVGEGNHLLEISGAGLICNIDVHSETEIFLFPYVEKGKTYSFKIVEYENTEIRREEKITVCAEGGAGELEVLNKDSINLQILQDANSSYLLKMDEFPETNFKNKKNTDFDGVYYQLNIRADKKIDLFEDYFFKSSDTEISLSKINSYNYLDLFQGYLYGSSYSGNILENRIKGRDFKVKSFIMIEGSNERISFKKEIASVSESNRDETVKVEIKPLDVEFLSFLNRKDWVGTKLKYLLEYAQKGVQFNDYYEGKVFENGSYLYDLPEELEVVLPDMPDSFEDLWTEMEVFFKFAKVKEWNLYGVHRTNGKIDVIDPIGRYDKFSLNSTIRDSIVTEYYLVPELSVKAEIPVDTLGGNPKKTVATCRLFEDIYYDGSIHVDENGNVIENSPSLINLEIPEITKAGYFIENLYTDKKCTVTLTLSDLLDDDLVLYPKWEKAITVSVVMENGEEMDFEIRNGELEYLRRLVSGQIPSFGLKDQLFFYKDSECEEPAEISDLTDGATVYVRKGSYEEIHVYYNMNDYSVYDMYTGVPFYENKKEMDRVERELTFAGYYYLGAYLDRDMENQLTENTILESGSSIYLNFKEPVRVMFFDNDFGLNLIGEGEYRYGINLDDTTYSDISIRMFMENLRNELGGKHPDSEEIFKGWYLDPEGNVPVPEDFVLSETTRFYMVWKPVYFEVYLITEFAEGSFVLNNGDKYSTSMKEMLFRYLDVLGGYGIEDWYLDPNYENPVSDGYCFEDEVKLYGKLIPPVTIKVAKVVGGSMSSWGEISVPNGSRYVEKDEYVWGIDYQLRILVQKELPYDYVVKGFFSDPLGFYALDSDFVAEGKQVIYVLLEQCVFVDDEQLEDPNSGKNPGSGKDPKPGKDSESGSDSSSDSPWDSIWGEDYIFDN